MEESEQVPTKSPPDMVVPPTDIPDSTTVPTDAKKEDCNPDVEPSLLLDTTTQQQSNIPALPNVDSVTSTLTHDSSIHPKPGGSGAPPDDENRETQFAYVLRRHNTIIENRIYSPWHYFGGFKWRLLIFPRGNHSSNHDLSVYLECGGPTAHEENHNRASSNGKEAVGSAPLTNSWNRPAVFSLRIVHPSSPIARAAVNSKSALIDPSSVDANVHDPVLSSQSAQLPPRGDVVKETSHIFRNNVADWGFLEFAPLSNLKPGFYADGDMNVVIMVKIGLQDVSMDPSFANNTPWDSRKETGLVGFKNQGATCYMNSLLQTLYMLSAFRKAVYNMPLPESSNDNSGSELSYALQKVFYELQFSPTVVKTKKLTESFGWDTTDAFTQHDVQELKLILCDELAEKMKKIAPDQPNTLSTLFQGKILNYIECVNVQYKSTREEEFSDLSLNVKGCRNIYESFKKYTEVEMMDGDNKYRADGFDELQEARKGVNFLKLPPVLQLHLKRFEYDITRDAMVKINDRYEFDTEIDLSDFVEGSKGDDVYVLHSVLVHIGDVNGGHYHAFIRPKVDLSDSDKKKPSNWFKFDDETVTPASEEAAVHDNYGVGGEKDLKRSTLEEEPGNGGLNGQNHPPIIQNRHRNYQPRRLSNAYMLQYLRKSDLHYLLSPIDEKDVPQELAAHILKEREEEEQRKRDNTERHLYVSLAVATDEDMAEHHGADLVNWEKVRSMNVKRATKLGELKFLLQREGLVHDARRMRLWKCSMRKNHTIRPDLLLANGDDGCPIDAHYRDSNIPGGYNVSLYTGRHGNYGYEEIVKLYAEDFCSKYCLSAGVEYLSFLNKNDRLLEKNTTTIEDVDSVEIEKNNAEAAQLWDVEKNFYLNNSRETLLFLKYYASKPAPKLQWLGHFVADRETVVKDLYPMMRDALAKFKKSENSAFTLKNDVPLDTYEEVSIVSIKMLDERRTLEAHQIPCDTGSSGDIVIFQESFENILRGGDERRNGQENFLKLNGTEPDLDKRKFTFPVWNGYQEESRGDGTDLPLGGRPLPLVKMYFDYLANRIKIEFKDRLSANLGNEARSIFFELSRKDSYRVARKVLSKALPGNVDPDYIRFFSHDFNREAPVQDAFRISDNDPLERLGSLHSLLNTGQPEYRTIWYERTEYHILEFSHKEEVRVTWRPDGGTKSTGYMTKSGMKAQTNCDGDCTSSISSSYDRSSRMSSDVDGSGSESPSVVGSWDETKHFSVLVSQSPLTTYADVMREVRDKVGLEGDFDLRIMEVKNYRIMRLILEAMTITFPAAGSLDFGHELRAEPVPKDETYKALGEDYGLMPVAHLSKEKLGRSWRGLTFFGEPFLIKVLKVGEPVENIRERIRVKIGVPKEEFNTWTLAEISQLKSTPLKEGTLYKLRTPVAMEYCTLAIEHKCTAAPKHIPSTLNRYADKPLKIRS